MKQVKLSFLYIGVIISLISLQANLSFAVPYTTRDLMTLCGFQGPCADTLVNGSAIIANDLYLKWYNAAGSGSVSLIKLDSSDNTIINGAASKEIKFVLNNDSTKYLYFDGQDATKIYIKFGNGATTGQELIIAANTDDGNDYSDLNLCAGGYCTSSRGAYITLSGEEAVNGGDIIYDTGAGDVHYFLNGGAETLRVGASIGVEMEIAKDFTFAFSGGTLAIQEATAGDKCMGALTCNGASDVTTSTTCATTGSRIFLTRTSLDADTTGDYYVKSISNGVSFTIACETNDTATLNWIIFHEAA